MATNYVVLVVVRSTVLRSSSSTAETLVVRGGEPSNADAMSNSNGDGDDGSSSDAEAIGGHDDSSDEDDTAEPGTVATFIGNAKAPPGLTMKLTGLRSLFQKVKHCSIYLYKSWSNLCRLFSRDRLVEITRKFR